MADGKKRRTPYGGMADVRRAAERIERFEAADENKVSSAAAPHAEQRTTCNVPLVCMTHLIQRVAAADIFFLVFRETFVLQSAAASGTTQQNATFRSS